ncbi:hypothetical protein RND81_06G193600 [Saponaria officinalis]|uniref:Uncharacterized protein n=1 Tax=Saponaria officinalis TaxID=3572 RepID=A0AAW1KDC8_SAPOF
MEGLIPYVIRAIKRQTLHKNGYRCLSNASRHDYDHLLASAGNSIDNGSSHRRTQSEFRSQDSEDYSQAYVVRNSSINSKGSFFVSPVKRFTSFREKKVHNY